MSATVKTIKVKVAVDVEELRHCHTTRAAEPEPEPEPAACCPHCGCEHGHLAQPTLAGDPVYICASCRRVSLREEWSR